MTDSHDIGALRAKAAGGAPDDLHRLAAALVADLQMEEAHAVHATAADAGHVGSLIELGRMRMYGVGTDTDLPGAVQAFERAEATGQPVAGYFLALIGLGNKALPRDEKVAARLLAAVQAGHPPALRAAAIHFGRKPNLQDQALAVQLLDHAAGRGDAVAAQLLAERLRRGEGVTANPEAASQLKARLRESGFPDLLEIIAVPAAPKHLVPPSTLALEEVLDPPAPTMLATDPDIAQFDGLLSVDECRLLVASAQPMLRPSQVHSPDGRDVGRESLRTSSDASFDPLMEDFALRLVQLRMAAAAGSELVDAEQLIVLRYEPGQEYRRHRDYLPPDAIERDGPQAGNRRRTICAYLNTPAEGGATDFPAREVRVEPQAGRAVVFDNLDADGRPQPDSLHAGLPVERGEKWLATLWLRERAYRAF
ncbi:2OG-Fe(II) oxygenase [Cognatilysobacter terrigena]|uniref:2OG-Fe(II) oxygenase n=1 Tax=Cognatilysobacter terrigena TaxID=2488749 RepID=UPI001FE9A0EB|nr:2OG-Fe(II) oxygenase [Lysobacter terrigena]